MSYIGRQNLGGAYRQLDDISSGFDGSDTTHTMQVNSANVTVGDVNQIILSLGGVIQKPGTDFTVSGSVLTFTTAPAANTSFFAVLLGSDNGGTVTPTDGSVTTAKLVDDAVTGAKLADDISITTTGAIVAGGGNGPTLGFQLKDTSGNAQPRLTNDANNDTVIRPGASGRQIMLANYANNATAVNVDDSGHVTKPLQPAFLVNPASDQNNIVNNDWVTIAFGTEIYDQNADFASNTFTAPVTGKYFLHCQIRCDQPDTASDYIWVKFVTSNRTLYGALYDLGPLSSDPLYWNMNISALADMDANDTVYVQVRSAGGTAQLDISSNTHFSGFLAC